MTTETWSSAPDASSDAGAGTETAETEPADDRDDRVARGCAVDKAACGSVSCSWSKARVHLNRSQPMRAASQGACRMRAGERRRN